MILEVILVLIAHDLKLGGGDTFFLLNSEGNLPRAIVDDQKSSLDVAAELLMQSTGLTALIAGVGWVELTQAPIVDSTDRLVDGVRTIAVPYVAVVPKDVKPIDGDWFPVGGNHMPDSTDHQEILVNAWNIV